jgi:hypothetical protein
MRRLLLVLIAFVAVGGWFPSAAFAGSSGSFVASEYVPPTYDNIARVLWALDMKDLFDDKAVDGYLQIAECDLFQKFYSNEFRWKKIREGTRDYLEKYKSKFSRRFEYVQPIFLDRYDFALKGFPVMPDQQFVGTTRLQFSANSEGATKCRGVVLRNFSGYPSGAILNLRTPFNLSFVRVPEVLAKEYLKMVENIAIKPGEGRPAFIRFRIRVDQFLNEESLDHGSFANFSGALDKIEVFADRELLLPLYTQSFD